MFSCSSRGSHITISLVQCVVIDGGRGGFGVSIYSTTKPIDVHIHCTITKQSSFGIIRVCLQHNLKQNNFKLVS